MTDGFVCGGIMQGKGSKRRPEDKARIDRNWDGIDWGKKRGKKSGRVKPEVR